MTQVGPNQLPLRQAAWEAVDDDRPFPATTLGDLFAAAVRDAPDRTALVDGREGADGRWTYAQLATIVDGIARWLCEQLRPGSRIALWAPSRPEWTMLELAAARSGMVLVPVNPVFRREEAAHVLRTARPALLVHGGEHRGNPLGALATDLADDAAVGSVRSIEELAAAEPSDPSRPLPRTDPDDLVQIQFTSGTTGPPKGARLHHRGLVGMPQLAVPAMGLGTGLVWLNMLPLFHLGGCGLSTIAPILARGTHVLCDRFTPERALELVEAEDVTVMGTVPTMLLALLDHPGFAPERVVSLEVVMSGGTTVAPDLVRRVEAALGARFVVAFGQTESHGNLAQTLPDDDPVDKAETVGRPLPHVAVRVVDPADGRVVPVDTVGELCARSPMVMAGYLDQPDATAATIDDDGYLHTGDLGTMDDRGYLRVVGRVKEMICRGGENISPREIEDRLVEHRAVAEVAVVGAPDDRLGEEVAAFVRPRPGQVVDVDELRAWLVERIAPFKVPRHWFVVDELPMTPSGKVQKFVLRERLAT